MLNAYISKDDVLKLLNETEDIEGFINRSDFQKKLGAIKCIKQPKPKRMPQIRIKNREALISSIDTYLSKVNSKQITPGIILHFDELTKTSTTNGAYVAYKTDWISEENGEEIDFNIMALDSSEIMKILNISKPTFSRFKKIGIIKKDNCDIDLYIRGIKASHKIKIDYYDLKAIKKNLTTK